MSSPPDFARRVAIITEFIDSIGTFDFDTVAGHLTDDAVMTLPFLDLPATTGKAAIVGRLSASVPRMFERMNFFYDTWYDVAGSGTVIAEYHSECPRRDGGEYRNSYISVFEFDGDRISLYKEYLNPTKMG